MERAVRARFHTQVYEEACEWFIECRAGDLDDIARAEFDRWLRKSPDHQSAYLEIAAIWNEGPTLDPANRWDLDTLIAQGAQDLDNVVALKWTTGAPSNMTRGHSSTRAPATAVARRRLFAMGASISLAAIALASYLVARAGVYGTALGEQRSLALDDGSTVQLDSRSSIRVRYGQHERTVDLLQGQALFHVAKDSLRPFIVYSGKTRVSAVGTQFDVYRKTDGTLVTVVEGRVAILANDGHPSGPTQARNAAPDADATDLRDAIFLAAGEQITVTPRAARRTLHPNLAGATAWTQRQLVFESTSLTEVADEFNRYNERKLVIDSSAVGLLHISGVFSSTDAASLIRFLRDRPALRVIETPTQIRVEKTP